MITAKTKSLVWGVGASLAMATFYLAIMFLTMTPNEVWFNFTGLWYLIVVIIIGFGVQIGLWIYVKNCGTQAQGAIPGAGGAASGVGMVACCAHHLADVLPVLGISGAAIFLTQYQRPFLILGLSINLLGIAYMLHLLNKHKEMAKKVNMT